MGIFSRKSNNAPIRGRYNVIQIENWLITQYSSYDKLINPLKLQKLLYLAYGWDLALTKNSIPLFDSPIEAFEYGPIVRETYRRYKKYGMNYINAGLPQWDMTPQQLSILDHGSIYSDDHELLLNLFDVYKNWTPIQLSSFTHSDGGAWDRTIESFGVFEQIPDGFIKDEFLALAEEYEKDEETIDS